MAIFVDGKRFADDGLMIALGITIEGKKIILGIEQTATENSRALEQFFEKLIQRGLNYKEGIFFVIDGAKGIAKAIERIFSSIAIIQRCQYHKVENVISYLPKGMQRIWRVKLRAAYQETKYDSAKRALGKLELELREINPSACASPAGGPGRDAFAAPAGFIRGVGKKFQLYQLH